MKKNYRNLAIVKIRNSMLNKFWDELVRNYDSLLVLQGEKDDHWRWILENSIEEILDALKQAYPNKFAERFGV